MGWMRFGSLQSRSSDESLHGWTASLRARVTSTYIIVHNNVLPCIRFHVRTFVEGGVSPEKLVVVPEAVDTDMFCPQGKEKKAVAALQASAKDALAESLFRMPISVTAMRVLLLLLLFIHFATCLRWVFAPTSVSFQCCLHPALMRKSWTVDCVQGPRAHLLPLLCALASGEQGGVRYWSSDAQ